MITSWWLLDVTIDGRVYRYSQEHLEINTEAGDTVTYWSGLVDLELAIGDEDVTVSILDPDVDWPTLAAALEGGACIIRRWTEGTTRDQAVVYTSGLAIG